MGQPISRKHWGSGFPAGTANERSPLFSAWQHHLLVLLSSKQEISAYSLLLNLSAPKQNQFSVPSCKEQDLPCVVLVLSLILGCLVKGTL